MSRNLIGLSFQTPTRVTMAVINASYNSERQKILLDYLDEWFKVEDEIDKENKEVLVQEIMEYVDYNMFYYS